MNEMHMQQWREACGSLFIHEGCVSDLLQLGLLADCGLQAVTCDSHLFLATFEIRSLFFKMIAEVVGREYTLIQYANTELLFEDYK